MSSPRKAASTRAPKRRARTTRKSAGGRSEKNSLVANINRRRRGGTSRPKSRSTVSKKSYADMKAGWPNSARKKAKRAHA